MAKQVPDMISGLGMAMRLLGRFGKKVNEKGGREEMLHFLSTEAGEENLDKLADLLVSLPWRVPKSVLMHMAREKSVKENGYDHALSDEHCFWEAALMKLGIPYERFVSAANLGENDVVLCVDELRDQLHGKEVAHCLPVTWKGEDYFVTSIGTEADDPMPGDVINIDETDFIHLTRQRYIDPDR